MAETLGSLIDKLSIVKLKQYHSNDTERLQSLDKQESQLINEIDELVSGAYSGEIAVEKLSFKSNKVYKKEGNNVSNISGSIGMIASQLTNANCRLWHVQEKVYEFENVPVQEKDDVVKQLAVLNLERTKCIDEIDSQFSLMITNLTESEPSI